MTAAFDRRSSPPAHLASYETVQAASPLDRVIFEEGAFYALSADEQRAQREKFVREAFVEHLERCPPYRRFAHAAGLGAEELRGEIALDAIPVIPTSAFRTHEMRSVDEKEIAKVCMSSGTRGLQARVHRDRTTLERLLGSVQSGLEIVERRYEHEVEVINLGPDRVEAGNIWFSYVLSLIELIYPATSCTQGGVFRAESALRHVEEALEDGLKAVVLGPPFLVLELLATMAGKGRKLDAGDRMFVVTAGGWKRATRAAIPVDEFDEKVGLAFGLSDRSRIRDSFNQVELNTVFFECSAREKHVPPWVHAVTRDPLDLRAQPRGETGLLSFLDASARSYPCFFVGDDVGVVVEGRCACGREGVRVRLLRRLERVGERGCALAIDRALSAPPR